MTYLLRSLAQLGRPVQRQINVALAKQGVEIQHCPRPLE